MPLDSNKERSHYFNTINKGIIKDGKVDRFTLTGTKTPVMEDNRSKTVNRESTI